MTPQQLDAMQLAAQKRLAEWINRSAAQHMRHIRAEFARMRAA